MRWEFSQVANAHCRHCLFDAFSNQRGREATNCQRPGNIVFNNSRNYLVIRVLENHTDTVTDSVVQYFIACIQAGYQDMASIRNEQGVTMLSQGRFAAAIVPKYSKEFTWLNLKADILECLERLSRAICFHLDVFCLPSPILCLRNSLIRVRVTQNLPSPSLRATLMSRCMIHWINVLILPSGNGRTS